MNNQSKEQIKKDMKDNDDQSKCLTQSGTLCKVSIVLVIVGLAILLITRNSAIAGWIFLACYLVALVLMIIARIKCKQNVLAKVLMWVYTGITVMIVIFISAFVLIMNLFRIDPVIAGKDEIISYAEEAYGECEFIREEADTQGEGKYRTVYLKDRETGIEYSVTSHLSSITIDGSSGPASESKISDYNKIYAEYVMDISGDEIDDFLKNNKLEKSSLADGDYSFFDSSKDNCKLYMMYISGDRLDEEQALDLAQEICSIIKKNDCKGKIDIRCDIVSGNAQNSWIFDTSA